MIGHYILDENHEPVEIEVWKNGEIDTEELLRWARWYEERDNCIVRQEHVGPYFVSTVFLAIDHGWNADRAPVLFETMAFDQEHRRVYTFPGSDRKWLSLGEDVQQQRYSAWADAVVGHEAVVRHLKACLDQSNAQVEEHAAATPEP